MTEQMVLIAIGVVVAAFVLRPLLRRKLPAPSPPKPTAATSGVSDEMAELELDHEMGRVSEEDYQRWRAELERAEPVPAVAGNGSVVAAPDTATERAEALVMRWRDAPRPTCPSCGLRPEAEARFCSNCGASLAP